MFLSFLDRCLSPAVLNQFFLKLQKEAATSDFKHGLGITAVNLAARLFRYDPKSAKLVQLVDRELQIFEEGDRELVETFVLAVKETLDGLQNQPVEPSNG